MRSPAGKGLDSAGFDTHYAFCTGPRVAVELLMPLMVTGSMKYIQTHWVMRE